MPSTRSIDRDRALANEVIKRKSKLDKINGNFFIIMQKPLQLRIEELRNNNNYNRLSNVNCNMYAIIINTIIVIVSNIIVMYCCNNNHLPILM